MTKQIQRDLLACEQHIGESAGTRDNFAGFDLFTVRGEVVHVLAIRHGARGPWVP